MTTHSLNSEIDMTSLDNNTMQAVLHQAQIVKTDKESGKKTMVKTGLSIQDNSTVGKSRTVTDSTPSYIERFRELGKITQSVR